MIVSSFASIYFVSFFIFYLHFYFLIHFEMIRCIVKSLIFNFNVRVSSHKPVCWSSKWTEYITGIYTQITMFYVNLIPKTLNMLPLSNLISLFYLKVTVAWILPLTLAKGASTKRLSTGLVDLFG